MKLPNVSLLHARCSAHLLMVGIVELLRLARVVNGLYCIICQLKRHKTVSSVKAHISTRVRRDLKVDYEHAETIGRQYTKSLVALLSCGEPGTNTAEADDHDFGVKFEDNSHKWNAIVTDLPDWLSGLVDC